MATTTGGNAECTTPGLYGRQDGDGNPGPWPQTDRILVNVGVSSGMATVFNSSCSEALSPT